MITINLDHWDRETEVRITSSQAGLNLEDTKKVVDIVRNYRKKVNGNISIRAAIMIGRVINVLNIPIIPENEMFVKVCEDILGGRGSADAVDLQAASQAKTQLTVPVTVEQIIRNVIPRMA